MEDIRISYTVDKQALDNFRKCTFRSERDSRLRTFTDAVDFVNERGFVFLYACNDADLPSLWTATAGNRPAPNNHDDPGHIIWDWKDKSLDKKVWYYARLLRKRNAMISLEMLPYFYALSPNWGDPDHDYLDQYNSGQMTHEAKLVYEALLQNGRMDSIALRQAARLGADDSYARFNKALDLLQREFRVLPVGISRAGAWKYAFFIDLTHRHFPNLIHEAGKITESAARDAILRKYLLSVGAATRREIIKITGWRVDHLDRSINRLASDGFLVPDAKIDPQKDGAVCLKELVTA